MKIINFKIFTALYQDKPEYVALSEDRAIVFIEGSLNGQHFIYTEYRSESSMENFGWRRVR